MTLPDLNAEQHAAPTPEDDQLARAVERALDAAVECDAGDVRELRAALRAYVADTRSRGAEPQQVVIALKTVLQRVAMPRMPPRQYREFSTSAVSCCIEEYYRAD